ncbi:hypothetical protein C8T65DRAFT_676625 [Cerioporus squamosus]|nr:hypothetical protein C8T65DRAFT_676625 [Cerioporus squamosus]
MGYVCDRPVVLCSGTSTCGIRMLCTTLTCCESSERCRLSFLAPDAISVQPSRFPPRSRPVCPLLLAVRAPALFAVLTFLTAPPDGWSVTVDELLAITLIASTYPDVIRGVPRV